MENCIFCGIIAGKIKAKIRYEDDNVIAFDDINPKAKVHILIVPKKHIPDIESVEDNELEFSTLLKSIKKVAKKVGLTDYWVRINHGKYQEVPHIHFHLMG